jgi:hypothetical protein
MYSCKNSGVGNIAIIGVINVDDVVGGRVAIRDSEQVGERGDTKSPSG